MRGKDQIIGASGSRVIEIETIEPHVGQAKNLRVFLRARDRGSRAIDPDKSLVGMLPRIECREDADPAAHIQYRPGSTDAICHARSDGQIIVVPLAIEDRQDIRMGGGIVERDLVGRGSTTLLLHLSMQCCDLGRCEGLPLPLKIGFIRRELPEAPAGQVGF